MPSLFSQTFCCTCCCSKQNRKDNRYAQIDLFQKILHYISQKKIKPQSLLTKIAYQISCISFTSYEQPIWISIFCNKFLFTYFVSKYWQDKSFELRPKYIKKCQYNSLHTQKNKNTLQHLKLGKLKFGIRKIGCLMSWMRYVLL